MQWWNEFLSWIRTSDGHQAVFTAGVILLAVVIGVVVTASVFRASIARLIRQQDHERKNAVIATLVDAAVDASAWNVLSQSERVLSDRASAQAETHLRLLPVKGSGVAANWASHELAELKHTSSTGGYQTQASVGEFRDRLVQWRDKPSRARKAFLADLERWRFSETGRDRSSETPKGPDSPAPERAPAEQRPTAHAVTSAAAAAPVVVGAGTPAAGEEQARTSTPTIVLPPSAGDASQDETRRLLADVDRLEVPSRERPVEELPPVGSARPIPAETAPEPAAETVAVQQAGGDEPRDEDDRVVRADEARFEQASPEAGDERSAAARSSD
jgi:hypothetical protein